MHRTLACLLILLGLCCNEWTVTGLLFGNGHEHDVAGRLLIRFIDLVLVAWGVTTLALGRRAIRKKVQVALVSMFVVVPLSAEVALRLSFLVTASPTRDPNLYAHYFSDDDYWKLHLRWVGRWKPHPQTIHPLLGWARAPVTSGNPMGLLESTRARLVRDGRKKVLFYGDSFVVGIAEPPDWIPNYMDSRIGSADVLDLGQGGYGTDQIYLLFRDTHGLADHPFVIIGIMLYDIDRAVLSVRTAMKPRLRVGDAGELEVTGVPIPRDQEVFWESAPLELRSFFLSFLAVKIRTIGNFVHERREEKEALNERILEEIAAIAAKSELEMLIVLFYTPVHMYFTGWRETFLKEQITRLGLPYLDTKPVLHEHCKRTGTPLMQLYAEDGGHHNAAGNRVIGAALVEYLRRRGYE